MYSSIFIGFRESVFTVFKANIADLPECFICELFYIYLQYFPGSVPGYVFQVATRTSSYMAHSFTPKPEHEQHKQISIEYWYIKTNKSLYENVQPSARNKLCTNIEFNNPKLNHQYSNFEMFLHMFSSFSVPTVNVI